MASRLAITSESGAVLETISLELQVLIISLTITMSSGAFVDSYNKCCAKGQVFDHNFTCTKTLYPMFEWHLPHGRYGSEIFSCNDDQELKPTTHLWSNDMLKKNLSGLIFCLEHSINGSLMIQSCPSMINETKGCEGILTHIKFWGADIAMHMNIVHVVLCLIVVILYMVFSDLGRRTYNRAVLRHNASLLSMGCTLTILGMFSLCHYDLNDAVVVILWLILQFFTLASAFWLNVICFDMTLVITQFRWMFGSFENSRREENRKFFVYGIFAWAGALIPTLFSGIMELCPEGSVSTVLRVGYTKYKGGQNLTVNMYFFAVPLVTLFFNNILFIYTSYKIFMIKKSTKILTRQETNVLWNKYFLFLRLYLLMGAPWFFGMLMACLNYLWLLKTFRIVQPIMWLLMLVTHKKVRRRIADRCGLSKSSNNQSCENCIEP